MRVRKKTSLNKNRNVHTESVLIQDTKIVFFGKKPELA